MHIIEKTILFTLGNVFVFHFMLPFLWACIEVEKSTQDETRY